ncbi:3-hydroxyacyl-CoA dehydrogenase NAD-binding domain-containing protein [Zhihengliuella halotolerans]|uniref:3-hydroxyacyl-CoA dehydrogenase n=1 Tax=Zhihengliuella halotolerans TaxID=370736 RepID=A0A4Q8AAY9_9MICC|nr:3-hydroxyacyl-CoA dehydrogenase NAD-binding domain-containing protein [Zhihengliuella halotolerans]RZU61174.1 3-hydroxyacyl-CoA dehydrogenase [Zhihengliuella halotolerans]
MTQDTAQDEFTRFADLAAEVPDEVITHSTTADHALPGGRTLAVITLDNGLDAKRPTTLGPNTLIEFGRALTAARDRAARGEIHGLAVIGKPGFFVAGADLTTVSTLRDSTRGGQMAELGHTAYSLLADLGVPTFAFVNGVALGGGLEVALAANYRTVASGAKGLGLPEAFIGLVPGWGGTYRLPRLIGPEAALKVMIENPLNNNRSLSAAEALDLGIMDVHFEQDTFLEESIAWAASVLEGAEVPRPHAVDPTTPEGAARWDAALEKAAAFVEAKISNAAPAPLKVLEVMKAGQHLSQADSVELEVNALVGLMGSHEFHNTVYAFLDLVQKRAKRPAGAPDAALARPIQRVGVVGAGLMAGQFALLFAKALRVPVTITDIDAERVERGLSYIRGELDKQVAKGRLRPEDAAAVKELVVGTTDKADFADADLVIEAVFEELEVKKKVFAEVEAVVSSECILATNTSSLSVTAMAADLTHPERVVGFHFFNPVAVMPLVEIVATEKTDDAVVATAFALAKGLRKTAVLVQDAAAFVVNRILLRLMGEIQNAYDDGTPALVADRALRPMGLPMTPFTLLEMVGIPVAQHVMESLHAAFGDRFRVSANLQRLIENKVTGLWVRNDDGSLSIPESTTSLLTFGDSPSTSEELLARTQDALAEEIGLLLAEGVVASPEDVDLCMILGAGWPMHLGGITPYLDQVGASERVNGRRFHS